LPCLNKRKSFKIDVVISKKDDVTIDDVEKALRQAGIRVRNVSLISYGYERKTNV